MKRIFNIVVNTLPFFLWMLWFYLALMDVDINPDLGMIQLLMWLGLPLIYSIYNLFISENKKEFAVNNLIFGASQVVGHYLAGILYYDHISSDSETILVINTFLGISILYISIATLIFYGIRAFVDKLRIHFLSKNTK